MNYTQKILYQFEINYYSLINFKIDVKYFLNVDKFQLVDFIYIMIQNFSNFIYKMHIIITCKQMVELKKIILHKNLLMNRSVSILNTYT